MNTKKKRVLTGSRPSGSPHLGNYFGAFRPMLDLQKDYDFYFFLADLHALNEGYEREFLRESSMQMVATLLACGLDPENGQIYCQSAAPEVCELAWALGCVAPYGMMMRAHSFKDAQAKGKEINMGVFNYPVLMAADILLYDADVVPVGQDQKQHLEMTRDFAQRFNHKYGDVFKLPEPLINEEVAVLPGLDGEKMSKSKNNVLPIFASDKQWKKQIMAIVTGSEGLDDPKDPEGCTVYKIFSLLASEAETAAMAEKYRAGGYGFGHAKLELLEKVKEFFGPKRDTYEDWLKRPDDLRDLLHAGAKHVRAQAKTKLEQVQDAVGLVGRPY